MFREIPEKLYAGAIVNYPENNEAGNNRLLQEVLHGVRELHAILQIHKSFKKEDSELSSYDLAHHAGLSLDEEYEMLHLFLRSTAAGVPGSGICTR